MTLSEAFPVLAGLALGAALGRLLDRSGFSLARALRWPGPGEASDWLRAWLLATALLWLGSAAVAASPWREAVRPLPLAPLAAAIGGFASGAAASLVGGDVLSLALGTGRTSLVAVPAFLAWAAGALAALHAVPPEVLAKLQTSGPFEIVEWRLSDLLGAPPWMLPAAAGAGLLLWLLRQPVEVRPGAMEWPKQGAGLALVAGLGWALAALGGETAGLNSLHALLNVRDGFAGKGLWLHPSVLVGAGLVGYGMRGALGRGALFPETPGSLWRLLTLVAAGFVLGLATAVAGACPAAHAFYGFSLMHLGSAVFTLAMWCGASLMGMLEWRARGRPGGRPSLGRGV